MKDLRVRIKAPITEYCSKCDYSASYSLVSNHVVCPKCGERSVSSYCPKVKHVTVSKCAGRYYLGDNSEQYQYLFYGLPDGMKRSILLDKADEHDFDTSDPFSLIEELEYAFGRFFYVSQDIKNTVSGIKSWLEKHREEQEALKLKYDIEIAKRNLYRLMTRGVNNVHR